MGDFTVEYRPCQFQEVWGNHKIKRVMQAWVKNDKFPKSIILVGDCGTGKTTIARLIAKTFVCASKRDGIEPCGKCSICLEPRFHIQEFDLTNTTVEEVRNFIRRYAVHLFADRLALYFDETQRWYIKNQEIFLKPIEEKEKMLFIFSTTSLEEIEPGILSRSVILHVQRPTLEEIHQGLLPIVKENLINISSETLIKLIRLSRNTPRKCLNAFNLLADDYAEINEETLEDDFIKRAILQG